MTASSRAGRPDPMACRADSFARCVPCRRSRRRAASRRRPYARRPLRSGVTASSRSSTSESAARPSDFVSIFSLAPGTKCTERRKRASATFGSPHHHRAAHARADHFAALVDALMLERDDATIGLRRGFAFADNGRTRRDRVADEDRIRERRLVEAEVAERGAQASCRRPTDRRPAQA